MGDRSGNRQAKPDPALRVTRVRCFVRETWGGVEPPHGGFADRSVTTSPPGQIIKLFFNLFKSSFLAACNLSSFSLLVASAFDL